MSLADERLPRDTPFDGKTAGMTVSRRWASYFDAIKALAGTFNGAIEVTTESELSAALLSIGANPATLLIYTDVAMSASVSIPVNVSCWFISPGRFTIAAAQTVTFAGAIIADRHQIFTGSGAADLWDAKIDAVYPEWWGAVALKAATGTPVNSTTALTAAVNSRRNVSLDQGIYGATSMGTIGTDGQVIFGQGMQHYTAADGQGGTTIKRLSGTSTMLTMGSYIGTGCRDLNFDGNSLGGSMLRWQSLYSEGRNLSFKGTTGTSYALYLSNVNTSNFYNLAFNDGNYGHIQTDAAGSALYSNFYGCTFGQVGAGHGLDLRAAQNLKFWGCVFDSTIRMSNNCRSIQFTGTGVETADPATRAWVSCDSSTWNPVFRDTAIQVGTAATKPYFEFLASLEVRVDGLRYSDLATGAGVPIIALDGCSDVSIRNVGYYCLFDRNVVDMTGTSSNNVTLENINSHSGTIGTIVAKANYLTCNNSNTKLTFLAGPSNVELSNWSGTVTRTNASILIALVSAGDPGYVALPTGATPLVDNGQAFTEANGGATTITNFTGGYNGQTITIAFTTANTTIDCSANANIKGNAGVDFVGAIGDAMTATRIAGTWYCNFTRA